MAGTSTATKTANSTSTVTGEVKQSVASSCDGLSKWTVDYWVCVDKPEVLFSAFAAIIQALLLLFAVFVAAYLAHRLSGASGREAHKSDAVVDKLRREVDALDRTWGLLSYLGDQHKENSILHWTLISYETKEKRYYYHYGNLERFVLHELNRVFYTESAGLHLDKPVKETLFEIRRLLMKLYFSAQNLQSLPEDQFIEFEKPHLYEAILENSNQLNALIRADVDNRYAKMKIGLNV